MSYKKWSRHLIPQQSHQLVQHPCSTHDNSSYTATTTSSTCSTSLYSTSKSSNRLKAGVKNFFKKIQTPSSKTSSLIHPTEISPSKDGRRKQRGRPTFKTPATTPVHCVESGSNCPGGSYLELSEIAAREARQLHRRRRSSRTRSCDKRRHYSSYFEDSADHNPPANEKKEDGEEGNTNLEEHYPYGDIGSVQGQGVEDHPTSTLLQDSGQNIENIEWYEKKWDEMSGKLEDDSMIVDNVELNEVSSCVTTNTSRFSLTYVDSRLILEGSSCSQNQSQENCSLSQEENGGKEENELDLTDGEHENEINAVHTGVETREEGNSKLLEQDESTELTRSEWSEGQRSEGTTEELVWIKRTELDFNAPVTAQIDLRHRQNMGYLECYLDKMVEKRFTQSQQSQPPTKPVRRLTLTPQLPPTLTPAVIPAPTRPLDHPDPTPLDPLPSIRPAVPSSSIDQIKPSYFETLRRRFVQVKRSTKQKQQMDAATLARIRRAKADRGPFWRVEVFERNRAKNKARDNSYAITFGFKLKRSEAQRRKIHLMSIGRLLKSKKSQKSLNRQENSDTSPRPQTFDIRSHDEFGLALEDGDSYMYQNLANFPQNPNSNRAQFTDHQNFHSSPLIPSERSYSDTVRPFRSHQNNFGRKSPSIRPGIHRSHQRSRNGYNGSSIVPPILENSSKLSEKTMDLLQKAGSASSSAVQLTTGLGHSSTGSKIFNEKVLTRIYTPKTEFTRQFAQLLPSYRNDDLF